MKFLAWAALAGSLAASAAVGQVNTISAKPGAINYIEGKVYLNDRLLGGDLKSTFLNPNDTLKSENGKAEVLLTPGVFLRLGENSEFRMVSPSLTDTQVELTGGELMVEATGVVKDNHLQVIDHGSITTVEKNGLYRFTADNPPLVAVLDGRAQVGLDDRKLDLKKDHQVVIADNAKPTKFDSKKTDDLYAWSNVRSEYEAAASYRVAQNASSGLLGSGGYGLGPGLYGSGWLWDSGFNSWAWLPGSGAFYSPFGYGFYSPGLVGYAPVAYYPLYGNRRGDGYWHGGKNGNPVRTPPTRPGLAGAPVPVRPTGVRAAAGPAPVHANFGGGGAAHPNFGSPGMSAPHAGVAGGGAHSSGGHGR